MLEIALNEHLMHTLGLRLQGMAHMRASALDAIHSGAVLDKESQDSARPPAAESLPAVPWLKGNVLNYRPDQVEHLVGSVLNLMDIERKKYAQIRNRRTRYESAAGLLDEAVTERATTKQDVLCKQHEAVLCALEEFLARIAPESCPPDPCPPQPCLPP